MSVAVGRREFNFWDHHPLHLPTDLITYIFSLLPPLVFGKSSLTCKQARVISKDPKIWQALCQRFHFKSQHIANFQTLFNFQTGILLPRLMANRNFRTQFIPTDQGKIQKMVLHGSDSVFYESTSLEIKKITLGSQEITPLLSRYDLGISSWTMKGHFLYLGSWDGNVTAWNWKTHTYFTQPDMHSGWICSLTTNEQFLASGCSGGEIHIWDLQTLKHRTKCLGHSSIISHMQFNNASLFTSGWNGNIIEWNCDTGTIIRSFFTADHHIGPWQVLDEHLYITSQQGRSLERYHWSQGDCQGIVLLENQDPIFGVYVTNFGKTIFLRSRHCIRVWNSVKGSLRLINYFFHLGASCATFKETFFCSGSRNGSFFFVAFHPLISFFDQIRPGSPKL